MTDYFEVLDRDGPARLGELRLREPVTTPAIGDEVIENAGSAWPVDRDLPEPREDVVTILPHRGMPPGTPDEVVEAFHIDPPAFDGPSGAVIDTRQAGDLGTDVYAISTVQGIDGHARAFREALIAIRDAIPDDTALYASGIATPANASLLAYAGVDIVDTDRARLAGTQGRYLTREGSTPLENLTELACPCSACAVDRSAFAEAACVDHNVAALSAELATIRNRIRRGGLRDYVSTQCRHVPWLTAALREFDQERSYLERHEPLFRGSQIHATTDDDLSRPDVRRYVRRVTERYTNRFDVPLVLLPCSATKPYSESQSHAQFQRAIGYRAHRVSLSSPVGVVPQELECTYPAQHYDIPVTGHWSQSESAFVADALERYLTRSHRYPRIIAHVPPGPYRTVVERAVASIDLDVSFTVEDHPTTDDSLARLDAALDGLSPYSRRERRENTVRALADYQFGAGAGEALFDTISVESPYPKHRVLADDGTLLATMVPEYGLLALTIAGARQWEASDVPTRTVSIDPFVPHGDVLAPGIRDADEAILVGDEVIIEGPEAYGVGRATMPGSAMRESTRGVAVDVRHSEERS